MRYVTIFTLFILVSSLDASVESAETGKLQLPQVGEIAFQLEGDDLESMSTWLEGHQHKDPNGVFSMRDGVLRAKDSSMGYIATKQSFADYHLQFEYKWGKLRQPSKYVRNAGVMLHCHGQDGSAGGRWISSIECQLAQGCEGDLILIRGKNSQGEKATNTLWSRVTLGDDGRPRWDPNGKATQYTGRQFWWNRHTEGFKELIDTRGDHDVASPLGEWTKVEVFSFNKQLAIRVNGHLVNHCYDVEPAKGKIAFQCEGYEVYYRDIQVHDLKLK